MMNFENYIKSDSDISLINDIVIETLSKNNSNIKMDFYDNHIKLCTKYLMN